MSDEGTPINESIRNEPPPRTSSEAAPNAPAPPAELTHDEKMWGMFAHLSALVAGWFGLAFLGPLLVWMLKKDESKFVDVHGKEALNFQLNMLIYVLIGGALSAVVGGITCGLGLFVTIPLLGVVMVYSLVMPIIAGVKANSGEYYEYPLTFRMIQ